MTPAQVTLITPLKSVRLQVGASIYSDRDVKVQALAPELEGLTAYVMSSARQRAEGTAIEFEAKEPVSCWSAISAMIKRNMPKRPNSKPMLLPMIISKLKLS